MTTNPMRLGTQPILRCFLNGQKILPPLALDDFNRANGPLVAPWIVLNDFIGADGQVVSNRAKLSNPSGPGVVVAIVDTGQSEIDVRVNIAAFGSNPGFAGVLIRYQDIANYVILQHEGELAGATTYGLYRKVAGGYTLMASIPVVPANGDELRITAQGTTYRAYVNGTLRATVTDAVPSTTATFAGFFASRGATQPTAEFDNFRAYMVS